MEALLTSIALVAIAEIGDKTQLLSFVLAARLRRPWPIIGGILVATLLNHALAGAVGSWLATVIPDQWLKWLIAGTFFGFGLWALKPDTLEDDGTPSRVRRLGPFLTTTIVFFLAEMGDKTQFATVALAARFDDLAMVVIGTTLGMMAANVPAVLVGEKLATRLPLGRIRVAAALLFVLTGVITLLS